MTTTRRGERRTMKFAIHAEALVTLPMLPNFLRTVDSGQPIDVAYIHERTLRAIGREWTRQLIEHAKRRKQQKAKP